MIPYGKQTITNKDIQRVIKILKSDYLTQGPVVQTFEREVAKYCNTNYGVSTNSASSALTLACKALGVKKGDSVWTSAITFVASTNCALHCNASIDLIDIDPKTYNISISDLEEKLINAKIKNKLPKVVIPVHLAGNSCDMKKIYNLSKKYHFSILEDASHCIGGSHRNKKIGSCQYSDITVFSFHPVKIMTTGEGGMALTNDFKLADDMQKLRSHGVTKNPNQMHNIPHGPWYYEQQELGYNFRLTDLKSALGLSQLKQVDNFIKKRNNIAKIYNNSLKNLELTLPFVDNFNHSTFHLYIIRIKNRGSWSQKNIFQKLIRNGINVNLHYMPIYKHPFYKKFKFKEKNFPNAETYYQEAISLPIFPTLTVKEIKFIVKTIKESVGHQVLF